jgi:Mg-chelatase subunit ChlD
MPLIFAANVVRRSSLSPNARRVRPLSVRLRRRQTLPIRRRCGAAKEHPGKEQRILLPTMLKAKDHDLGTGELDADYLASTLTARLGNLRTLQKKQRADIMFILDCTQSMAGELQAIKDAIFSFVGTIQSDGVRVRIGLIEFRDRLINEEHRVLSFNGAPFTNDPDVFKREAKHLYAIGGGDEPESSLDAVLLAVRQPFEADSQKVLVLVTDAPPHIPDREARGVEEVAQAIRAAGISQFYLVIPVQEVKNQVYLKLCEGTRSMAFDLGKGDDFNRRAEDFNRTLMSLGKTISAATR